MSRQLDNAISEVNTAMKQLREAVKGIPARREGFKRLHDEFTKDVATLTTALSYARGMLDENATKRRKKTTSE
ncbi:hypothetical protein Q5530_15660 [Saccharothrix sp. BKS2]|uniref:hypothetical protein n=1 Tax=Saccharothrix sp. BKS2 TaxID=3064400 RepID=UPI0039E9894E